MLSIFLRGQVKQGQDKGGLHAKIDQPPMGNDFFSQSVRANKRTERKTMIIDKNHALPITRAVQDDSKKKIRHG
jgi:hypothetical protein